MVYSNVFQLQLATVDQNDVDLGPFGGAISSQGLNGVPSPSSFFIYTLGEGRFAAGDFNGVSYNIPDIDTLPHVVDGQTAKVNVNTGATSFVPDQATGFTRIHFVYTRAETLTVKTVDQNDNLLLGQISMPGLGVGTPGIVIVPNYVTGQGFFLNASFFGITYSTPNIDPALFRPGRTVRVDALTGALLADGPPTPPDQAAIWVVYQVIPITIRTIDQNGSDIDGLVALDGIPEEPLPWSINAVAGGTLGVKGAYLGGSSGDFIEVTIANGVTTLDVITPETDITTAVVNTSTAPGPDEILIKFQTVDVTLGLFNKAANPIIPLSGDVEMKHIDPGFFPNSAPAGFVNSPQVYNVLDGGRVSVSGQSPLAVGTQLGSGVATFVDVAVASGQVITVDGTVDPPTVTGPNPGAGTQIDILLQTNQAPVLTVPGPQAVDEGVQLSFTVSATDPDDDGIVFSIDPSLLPAGHNAVIDPQTGDFTWTPTFDDAGLYDLPIIATDDGSPVISVEDTVQITVNNVNQPPSISGPAGKPVGDPSMNEGEVLEVIVLGSDPDGSIPILSVANEPVFATFVDDGNGTGTLTLSPDFTQAGVYPGVEIIATDSEDTTVTVTETITIMVNDVNQPPVLTVPGPQEVDEGSLLEFTVSATDPDGNGVTFSMDDSMLPAGHNAVLDPQTGEFSWTPNEGDAGTYEVKFTATDDGTPPETSSEESVSITVNEVNDGENFMFLGGHKATHKIQLASHPDRQKVRKGDIIKFSRDELGNAIPSTVELFFKGSEHFKKKSRVNAASVRDFDGDDGLEMIFSVDHKTKLKSDGTIIERDDLFLYDPNGAPMFSKFLDGSQVFKFKKSRKHLDKKSKDDDDDDGHEEKDDDDDGHKEKDDNDDDEEKPKRSKRHENIDGVSVYKVSDGLWRVYLTTKNEACIGELEFDRNDVVAFDFDPVTQTATDPIILADLGSLFKGNSNIDALDVVDDDRNGTFESIVFSTQSKERLRADKRTKLRSTIVYLLDLENEITEELFDPKEDGLTRKKINIGAVSTLGALKPWGEGPKPEEQKPAKGAAKLAKVGDEDAVEELADGSGPTTFGMDQNYPNPFNPVTTIRYALPEAADVNLVVYNILGQAVKVLVNGSQGAGYHTARWDSTDEIGRSVATGVYFYRLQAGSFVQVKKMLLTK